MNYNEIKLSIYESFNNGEIDEMEKDILLEKLEERCEEDNNEDITLEEAMDTISSYLYEKTSGDKQIGRYRVEQEQLDKRIKKLEKLMDSYENEGKDELYNNTYKKYRKLCNEYDNINAKISRIGQWAHDDGRLAAKEFSKNHTEKALRYKELGKLAAGHSLYRGNSKREPEVKGKYKTTNGLKESVDELRLDVYESFNNGNITEEEKNMFLEYLNLDNYE